MPKAITKKKQGVTGLIFLIIGATSKLKNRSEKSFENVALETVSAEITLNFGQL